MAGSDADSDENTQQASASTVSNNNTRTRGGNLNKQPPPRFKPEMTYANWKKKLLLWTIVTGVVKLEQAIMVVLNSFDGPIRSEGQIKAEKVADEMKEDELHCELGLTNLLANLDKVFLSESTDEAYIIYTKFIQFCKSDSMSTLDYIIEFDHLNNKMIEHEIQLPEKVLTFKLLDGAMLEETQRQMALTFTPDLTLPGMKSALKRLFSKYHGNGTSTDAGIKIKSEDIFAL